MSVNRYRPHIMILPEDDANRQLANGFVSHAFIAPRSVQVLPSECYENRRELWKHELLQHNAGELERMTLALRPILFPQV